MDVIAKKVHDHSPIEVFTQAVENVKPHIEVRSITRGVRVSGADAGEQGASAIVAFSYWILMGGPGKERARDPFETGRRVIGCVIRERARRLRVAKTSTAWRMRIRLSPTLRGRTACEYTRRAGYGFGAAFLIVAPANERSPAGTAWGILAGPSPVEMHEKVDSPYGTKLEDIRNIGVMPTSMRARRRSLNNAVSSAAPNTGRGAWIKDYRDRLR